MNYARKRLYALAAIRVGLCHTYFVIVVVGQTVTIKSHPPPLKNTLSAKEGEKGEVKMCYFVLPISMHLAHSTKLSQFPSEMSQKERKSKTLSQPLKYGLNRYSYFIKTAIDSLMSRVVSTAVN